MIVGFDCEVFYSGDWLFVFVDTLTGEETVVVNDRDKLAEFYESHKNYIYFGYNSRNYDVYIYKAILLGLDPVAVSRYIIEENGKGFLYDKRFSEIPLVSYDCQFDRALSLKKLEAFMGDDIRETTVDFKKTERLTDEEIEETIKYCRHDVLETLKVASYKPEEFNAYWDLIKMFDMPLDSFNRTKAQLCADILEAERKPHDDEWDLEMPSYDCKIEEYRFVPEWLLNKENHWLKGTKISEKSGKEIKTSNSLDCVIAGCPTKIAWGGIHGARNNVQLRNKRLINVDVASEYPTIQLKYKYYSRNMKDPKKLDEIYHKRLDLKAKGLPEATALKIAINSVYGICGAEDSKMYDPRAAHMTCLTGQILMTDLAEQLSKCKSVVLQQLNTDGILFELQDDSEYDNVISICKDWEKRSGMDLEFDEYKTLIQRDVNNYILVNEKGKVKSKGSWVKKTSILDYDLPIVNEAIRQKLVFGIPVEKTIQDCDELIKFQKIYVRSSNYTDCFLGCEIIEEKRKNPETGRLKTYKEVVNWGERMNEKTYRIFATKNGKGSLYKYRAGGAPAKFSECPAKCEVFNDSVIGKSIIKDFPQLDKQWYIDLANKRVEEFLNGKNALKKV